MNLAHYRMSIHELLNKDPDIVPDESPLIILDSKCNVCMDNNGKDTKHTMNISIRVNFLRNDEKCKIQNIEWCEGSLKLEYIVTALGEPPLGGEAHGALSGHLGGR